MAYENNNKHKNNYELAEQIQGLFNGEFFTHTEYDSDIGEIKKPNIDLPNKEVNACINCPNAIWYSSGQHSVSATCPVLNVIVFKTGLIDNENKKFPGISACSKNPNFKPEIKTR